LGRALEPPPHTTALGALLAHVTGGHIADGKSSFQPMNVNFGLFPELPPPTGKNRRIKGKDRKQALAERALHDLDQWLGTRAAAE
jgi:methylenetetrahydrofolate--tRNA-(uracil-5-)-methyltransferase